MWTGLPLPGSYDTQTKSWAGLTPPPVLIVTVGDVINQISKDKKEPNLEWVHNSKNVWEVGIIKRGEEFLVTTLAKLMTKTKLQSALALGTGDMCITFCSKKQHNS